MPRERLFSEEEILTIAVRCFSDRGYDATSIRDLTAEMGISATSLYNAFGDKRSLFRKALAFYLATRQRPHLKTLAASYDPARAIIDFLKRSVDEAGGRRPCLLVATAIDVAPHDSQIAEDVAEAFAEMEAGFARMIRRGQQAGTITNRTDPQALAQMLISLITGLRVLARSDPDHARLRRIVETAEGMLS